MERRADGWSDERQSSAALHEGLHDQALVLPDRRISTFWGLADAIAAEGLGQPLKRMNLRGNALEDFDHFGTHEQLVELDVADNRIASLRGLTKQRSLRVVHFAGNPIARHPHYRVMLLLTVGFSIAVVDARPIEAAEREAARRLGPNAALATSYGWHLDVVPRAPADYEAIIAALREERRRGRKSKAHHPPPDFVTIPAVLQDIRVVRQEVTPDDKDEVQSRALVHLSQRVVQLEKQLAEAHSSLASFASPTSQWRAQQQHQQCLSVGDVAAASPEAAIGPHDMPAIACVRFPVIFRSNLTGQQEARRCLLDVEESQLVVRHCFTQLPICECAAADVVSVSACGAVVTVQAAGGLALWFSTAGPHGCLVLAKCIHLRGVHVDFSGFSAAVLEQRAAPRPAAPAEPRQATTPIAEATATTSPAVSSPPKEALAAAATAGSPSSSSASSADRAAEARLVDSHTAPGATSHPHGSASQVGPKAAAVPSPLESTTKPAAGPDTFVCSSPSSSSSTHSEDDGDDELPAPFVDAARAAPANTGGSRSSGADVAPAESGTAPTVAQVPNTMPRRAATPLASPEMPQKSGDAAATDDASSSTSTVKLLAERRRNLLREIAIDSDSDSD